MSRNRHFVGNLLLCFFLFSNGCSLLDPEEISAEPIPGDPFEELTQETVPYMAPITSSEILQRAYLMATLKWTPLKSVPYKRSQSFKAGSTVTGVPYSSVKEINTYLFQDVSYHTFMTAVHNPNSVLYTENISKEPYNGANCGTYYGAVCSSSIMWAMGIDIPFFARHIAKLPYMEKVKSQTLDSLKVCDILWRHGHVQMVFGMEYKDSELLTVTLFESTGRSARLKTYSASDFANTIWPAHYDAYRYKYITYTPYPEFFEDPPTITYNDDLCPSKGDRAVYRADEPVTIHIFNPDYQQIVLLKDDQEISVEEYEGGSHQYQGLGPGIYTVFLLSDEQRSEPVCFETIDTTVDYSLDKKNNVTIFFASKDLAHYAVLCLKNGDSTFFPIHKQDCEKGQVSVPGLKYEEYYCKIVFKGKFGSIINTPIRVQ